MTNKYLFGDHRLLLDTIRIIIFLVGLLSCLILWNFLLSVVYFCLNCSRSEMLHCMWNWIFTAQCGILGVKDLETILVWKSWCGLSNSHVAAAIFRGAKKFIFWSSDLFRTISWTVLKLVLDLSKKKKKSKVKQMNIWDGFSSFVLGWFYWISSASGESQVSAICLSFTGFQLLSSLEMTSTWRATQFILQFRICILKSCFVLKWKWLLCLFLDLICFVKCWWFDVVYIGATAEEMPLETISVFEFW